MPITKIPIVHKFGIISHSQRLELQERLLKQSYLQTLGNKQSDITSKNVLEVTEDFVQQLNNVADFTEQERLENVAFKLIERVKRKAGLKDGGIGNHVNLPIAWSELTQLAQCKGKVQDESLDVLLTSLDQAPLDKLHIPALCYLAEMVLYWLRTDAVNEPYLRTVELKLLRMGHLVFNRLFYHHMSGHLIQHEEAKYRLYTYLDGFAESQSVYSPYPNALLSLRYILEVGRIILGETPGAGQDPEVTEDIKLKAIQQQTLEAELEVPDSVRDDASSRQSVVDMLYADGGSPAKYTTGAVDNSHSGVAISNSVHDLSPTLWHALDVWRCVRYNDTALVRALNSLSNCALKMATESWVDAVCAMQILSDAAKVNLATLKELQSLARGLTPPVLADSSCGSKEVLNHDSISDHVTSLGTSFATQPFLTNIYEQHEVDQVEPSSATPGKDRPQHGTQRRQMLPLLPEKTMTSGIQAPPTTAMNVEIGSEHQRLGSEVDSQSTYTNLVTLSNPGIHGWHWEVAVTYTDMLADVCLHSGLSSIQKLALLGNNRDVSALKKQEPFQGCPMISAALLDLISFKALNEKLDGGSNDWSWRVRYSAIHGLVKICRCTAGDAAKEGMRTVAWNSLLRAHSMERDGRVLEALKVGQVDASIEKLLSEHLVITPSTLGAKLACHLSKLYLPRKADPQETSRKEQLPTRSTKKPAEPEPRKNVSVVKKKNLRTSLKDEIQLATALYEPTPSFKTRTNFDLRRLVEDQWRKEQQRELESEEAERLKTLKKKQSEVEEIEKERDDRLKESMASKQTARQQKQGSKRPTEKAAGKTVLKVNVK